MVQCSVHTHHLSGRCGPPLPPPVAVAGAAQCQPPSTRAHSLLVKTTPWGAQESVRALQQRLKALLIRCTRLGCASAGRRPAPAALAHAPVVLAVLHRPVDRFAAGAHAAVTCPVRPPTCPVPVVTQLQYTTWYCLVGVGCRAAWCRCSCHSQSTCRPQAPATHHHCTRTRTKQAHQHTQATLTSMPCQARAP
jgi:hypothetical protein